MINYKRGLTIIEFLIATAVMLLVVAGTLMVYLMSSTVLKESYAQIELQQKSGMAMEKMLRGPRGENGIREAQSVSITGGTAIEYTDGVDGVTRSFTLNGTNIEFDSDTSSGTNPLEVITDYVDSLSFTEPVSGVVKIDLGLLEDIGDKNISVNLSSQVTLRND